MICDDNFAAADDYYMMASAMIIVMLGCASWRCDVFYFMFSMTSLCIVIVECTCVHACALA